MQVRTRTLQTTIRARTPTFSAPAMASEGTLRSAFTQQTLPVPSLSSRPCRSTMSVYALLAGEARRSDDISKPDEGEGLTHVDDSRLCLTRGVLRERERLLCATLHQKNQAT